MKRLNLIGGTFLERVLNYANVRACPFSHRFCPKTLEIVQYTPWWLSIPSWPLSGWGECAQEGSRRVSVEARPFWPHVSKQERNFVDVSKQGILENQSLQVESALESTFGLTLQHSSTVPCFKTNHTKKKQNRVAQARILYIPLKSMKAQESDPWSPTICVFPLLSSQSSLWVASMFSQSKNLKHPKMPRRNAEGKTHKTTSTKEPLWSSALWGCDPTNLSWPAAGAGDPGDGRTVHILWIDIVMTNPIWKIRIAWSWLEGF